MTRHQRFINLTKKNQNGFFELHFYVTWCDFIPERSSVLRKTSTGFKEHGSTNACTFMVKETIQYYLQNGSNVYGTVLDATKAFDRNDFCKLFREMIKRKLPPTCYTFDHGNVR